MIQSLEPAAIERIPRRLRSVEERFVAHNGIRLLRDGSESYPAMLEAIAGAREQVLLEMYWFDSDRTGRRFARALAEAASRGIEVALIYDAVGSIAADRNMFAELELAGVKVVEFNPLAPWKRRFRLDRLTRRDHRKLLIVDGRIGFTGGINLADPWLSEEDEGGGWRDDMVRIEGPAVRGFVECFRGLWQKIRGPSLTVDPGPKELQVVLQPLAKVGQAVQVLGQGLRNDKRAISRAYLSRIYRAKRRIWIANSYFIPDRKVIRALNRAARRGVDVRILLPQVSDVPIVDWASRAVWPRLLRNGVRLFEWTVGILHCKTAVIDSEWSTIGSFNMDHLSVRRNLEVNVAVVDAGFAAEMEASFLRDLASSSEVDLRSFRFRSLGERLLEFLAYRVRKLL
jgi:cardiolipin synthase